MRFRIILINILGLVFFSGNCLAQVGSTLTYEEINNYTDQSKHLVSYLEGTLNFLGDSAELPSDKDIVFNESYLKVFVNEKVQIEDDLDENREMPLNKDVQAYLKDIDFFYKNVNFKFDVEKTEQLVSDSGLIVFKLTLNRHLEGITVNNDTVNNNQLRYIEVNLDPLKKDLKIASIYTTKVREKEELRYWWNDMSDEWKNYFGKSVIVYDTLPFKDIIWFSDSSLVCDKWIEVVTVDTLYVNPNDSLLLSGDNMVIKTDTLISLITDTIFSNTSTIYRLLKSFKKIKKIDLSNNLTINDLLPLSELADLEEINISNTLINDLKPIRNLNKLEIINCSGTPIDFIEPLRYISAIKELNLSDTPIENIEVIENLYELNELDLSNTRILKLNALSALTNLTHLKISGTRINDLTPIKNLKYLSDLNLSNTLLQDLTSIDLLSSLQNLNIDSTNIAGLNPLSNFSKLTVLQANYTAVANLSPLNDISSLKVIYCDNSNVTMNEANDFMDLNPQCLVIYNSQELINWWDGLSAEWKSIFTKSYNISLPITKEKLHQLIKQTRLSVAFNKNISSLEPLSILHRLEELDLKHTPISDLSDLSGLNNMERLNISNTNVNTIEPLSTLQNIKQINFENTDITDLSPLSGSADIELVYCDNSKISLAEALKFKNLHNSCLIIYQSQKLRLWWNNLEAEWKQLFVNQFNLPVSPSSEELQELVDLTELIISNNMSINNLNPLHIFVRLEQLTVSNTSIVDISPITTLSGLKKLNISSNPVFEVGSVSNLINLSEFIIENTSVEDLEPVSGLKNLVSLNIAGTRVKSLKYIQNLNNLEKLYINNTRVKSLKPIKTLSKLELLQCYNTSVKGSKIDEFRALHPKTEVVYY